jgi:hypothetical protein
MSLPELHVRNPDWQLAGDLLLAASGGDETAHWTKWGFSSGSLSRGRG